MEKTRNQAFIWLAGLVFVDRDFVRTIEEKGIDNVLSNCPINDLTELEKKSFIQAMSIQSLRAVVRNWWMVSDQARISGELQSPDGNMAQNWVPDLYSAERMAV